MSMFRPLFLVYLVTTQEAIRYYEPIVKKQSDNILEVPAIVLANLCVSHIMISQNEEAEELMRKVGSAFFYYFQCTYINFSAAHGTSDKLT